MRRDLTESPELARPKAPWAVSGTVATIKAMKLPNLPTRQTGRADDRITLRNDLETVSVLIFPTGLDKSDGGQVVYTVVASEVLDHTDVRGKMDALAIGRHGGVTAVKGVPR